MAVTASAQCGVFSRRQVLAAGGTDDVIAARLSGGRWMRVAPGVYSFPGIPRSHLRDLWIAHLTVGPRSWVSHEGAGSLHALTGASRSAVVLCVPHGDHPRIEGLTVRETRDPLLPQWFTTIEGLPVTTVEKTIVDLAGRWSRPRLRTCLEDAVAARQTGYQKVAATLGEVCRPGKRGMRKLGLVLDDCQRNRVPPMSQLERMLHELLERGGEPPLVRQYPFPGRQAVKGCVDGAYPPARLVVEADGRQWHTRISDLKRDHLRDAEAARAGWQVLRLIWEVIDGDPEDTLATVRETRKVRGG